jgi:hypothetical protein
MFCSGPTSLLINFLKYCFESQSSNRVIARIQTPTLAGWAYNLLSQKGQGKNMFQQIQCTDMLPILWPLFSGNLLGVFEVSKKN